MACAINVGKELVYGSVAIKMSIKFDNVIFGILFQFWKFILKKLYKYGKNYVNKKCSWQCYL